MELRLTDEGIRRNRVLTIANQDIDFLSPGEAQDLYIQSVILHTLEEGSPGLTDLDLIEELESYEIHYDRSEIKRVLMQLFEAKYIEMVQ